MKARIPWSVISSDRWLKEKLLRVFGPLSLSWEKILTSVSVNKFPQQKLQVSFGSKFVLNIQRKKFAEKSCYHYAHIRYILINYRCFLHFAALVHIFYLGPNLAFQKVRFRGSKKKTRGKSKNDRAGPIAIKYVDNAQYHTASLRHSKKGQNIRIIT